MVIFNSYVKLPEFTSLQNSWSIQHTQVHGHRAAWSLCCILLVFDDLINASTCPSKEKGGTHNLTEELLDGMRAIDQQKESLV